MTELSSSQFHSLAMYPACKVLLVFSESHSRFFLSPSCLLSHSSHLHLQIDVFSWDVFSYRLDASHLLSIWKSYITTESLVSFNKKKTSHESREEHPPTHSTNERTNERTNNQPTWVQSPPAWVPVFHRPSHPRRPDSGVSTIVEPHPRTCPGHPRPPRQWPSHLRR